MLLSSVSAINDRLSGSKQTLVGNNIGNLALGPYKKQMGTGVTDVWSLFMNMDGTPSVFALVGQSKRVDVSGYFGKDASNLLYQSVEVLDNGTEVLGLAEEPKMRYGELRIHPTKPGCARLKITAVAGSSLPTPDAPGGMLIERTISVIARPEYSQNGAWF